MFDKFCLTFDVKFEDFDKELKEKHIAKLNKSFGAVTFMKEFQGQTFKEGLYRVHKTTELDKWNNILFETFPSYTNKIFCFSYD